MRQIVVLLSLSASLLVSTGAQATDFEALGARTGLGQDSPKEPAMLRNLKLTDPLVQQKYLNEPDMLRFLRGTYSEACSRGMLVKAATTIKLDVNHEYPPELKAASKKLLDSQRLWKMSSFELEAIFGLSYLSTANYCDCLMKEVSDADLVNPKKGMEVIGQIKPAAQASCKMVSKEKTERQVALSKQAGAKPVDKPVLPDYGGKAP